MSEVDRLSNSGLYPALPIADRQSGKESTDRRPLPQQHKDAPPPGAADKGGSDGSPRPPKSLIDEYA
jgi:hypothetical protein